MTKQDILNMKDSKEIMKTLMTHRELWDSDVNEHLKKMSKQRIKDMFSDDDVIYTPAKRNPKD